MLRILWTCREGPERVAVQAWVLSLAKIGVHVRARAGNAVVLFGCACEADGALVACVEITGIACSCAAHFFLPIGVGRVGRNC